MKHLLTSAAVAALVAVSASPAGASVISAGACVPSSLLIPCAPASTIASGPGPVLSVPATTVGGFSFSGSAISGITTTGATFNSQTITVSTTTGGLLDIYLTIQDVPTQQLPLLFTSTFTSNQQNATTHSVIESTWEDNGNRLFNAGLSTQLASATLTSAILQTAGPFTTTVTPGGNISLTELYQIQLQGCATEPNGVCTANLTIDLNAAQTRTQTPEPLSLSILGVGLVGLGLARRFRRG